MVWLWERHLLAKPDDPSSVCRTYGKEGENGFHKVVLQPPHIPWNTPYTTEKVKDGS